MNFTPYFTKGISNDKNFGEAFTIARENSLTGNIWVIGGVVYRNIVNELYKKQGEDIYDFDFIAEKPFKRDGVKVDRGWELIKTGLGELRFVNGKKQIDLVALDNAINPLEQDNIKDMSRDEKLESYFRRVPLTVQAIAYDTDKSKIIGDIGIKAIERRKIEINNLDECLSFCKRRKISVREFMSRKGKDLGFEVIFPKFSDAIKLQTEEFYNIYQEEYQKNRTESYDLFVLNHLKDEVKLFLKKLNGKRILDLGSGPGRDAVFLKENSLEPTCVDLSPAMVKSCKERGLEAYLMDMENLEFAKRTFDGIWAYASLVHIPKRRIYNTLARINELLKPDGLLFLGMIEGNSEVFYESESKPGKKRFFALYKDDEFKKILSDYFEIISTKSFITASGKTYLNYVCRKI